MVCCPLTKKHYVHFHTAILYYSPTTTITNLPYFYPPSHERVVIGSSKVTGYGQCRRQEAGGSSQAIGFFQVGILEQLYPARTVVHSSKLMPCGWAQVFLSMMAQRAGCSLEAPLKASFQRVAHRRRPGYMHPEPKQMRDSTG